jgi:hypothetical protein
MKMNALWHRFNAGCPDFDFEADGSDCFSKKGRFLILGFCEGYGDLGVQDGDGEAGETSAGAEVE